MQQWWRDNLDLPRYYSYRAIVECIHHYDIAGYVVVATSLLACVLMWRIQRGITAYAAAPARITG